MPIGAEGSGTNYWNYSDKTKENYATSITGDIVEIHQVFSIERFNPKTMGQIQRFENGNPKMNWEIIIDCGGEIGELMLSLPKNSRLFEKIWQVCVDAGEPAPRSQNQWKRVLPDMLENANVSIATKEGQWGTNNPRPWNFRVNGKRKFAEYRGFIDMTKDNPQQPQVSEDMKQAAEEALREMEANNPSLAAAVRKAWGTQGSEQVKPVADMYDEDIPF